MMIILKKISFFLLISLLFACSPKIEETNQASIDNVKKNTNAPILKTDERGYIVKVGDQSPEFEMTLIDGTKTSIADLKGKVVMLQFTASWCGVCRKEMPHIEKEIWLPNKNKDFVVIGVDRDEPLEKVQKFIAQMKTTYPIALDPGADIFGKYADKKSGVTRNVVLDKTGKIVFLTRLFDPVEFEAMKHKIEALLVEN